MMITMTSVISDTASAVYFASSAFADGKAVRIIAPARGTTPAMVTHGKPFMLEPHHQQQDDQYEGAGVHVQRVGAHVPGLQFAQPARRAADQRGHRVHQPVDTSVIEVN